MKTIFAVTENNLPLYERLEEVIDGSQTGILKGDSSDVITFIVNAYDVKQKVKI